MVKGIFMIKNDLNDTRYIFVFSLYETDQKLMESKI